MAEKIKSFYFLSTKPLLGTVLRIWSAVVSSQNIRPIYILRRREGSRPNIGEISLLPYNCVPVIVIKATLGIKRYDNTLHTIPNCAPNFLPQRKKAHDCTSKNVCSVAEVSDWS